MVCLGAAGTKLAASAFEVSQGERFGDAPWFMHAVGIARWLGALQLWMQSSVA